MLQLQMLQIQIGLMFSKNYKLLVDFFKMIATAGCECL